MYLRRESVARISASTCRQDRGYIGDLLDISVGHGIFLGQQVKRAICCIKQAVVAFLARVIGARWTASIGSLVRGLAPLGGKGREHGSVGVGIILVLQWSATTVEKNSTSPFVSAKSSELRWAYRHKQCDECIRARQCRVPEIQCTWSRPTRSARRCLLGCFLRAAWSDMSTFR